MSDTNLNDADGGGLRKQLEEVLAANKALRERVEVHEATQRKASVEGFLSSKGLDPAVAKFVPAEVADEKAIETWVSENGKLFAAAQQSSNTGNSSNAGEQQTHNIQTEPVLDIGGREAWSKIERVASNGNLEPVDMASVNAQIESAQNPAELMSILRQYSIS